MLTLLQFAKMNSCIWGQKEVMTQPGFNLPVLAKASCAMYSLVNKITVSVGS